MSIDVKYFADSDTLSLWTGAPAAEAAKIAEGVVVDFDAYGNVVGFTLERAAALLRPMLDPARPAAPARGERPAMDDHQLETTLRAVGKACFVRYYERADDPALAQQIRDADGYETFRSRASGIRSIVIRYGRGRDALRIIADSGKLDLETRRKAAALLAHA